jgi:tripartite-type tricarboxylate transporter receptor subunit TctC
VPDAPTISEIDPELDISLWNGLFVHKDTPVEAREKIAAIASKTIASDKAKKFAEETGAQIYWKDAQASKEQISRDAKTIQEINELVAQ